ncbi:MAG: AmmeMemoRadiSam system protein B [Candidatus Abyssubacteria bacterium]
MDFPKLRAVEAFPVEVSGQHMIGLRDPTNFASEILAVPRQLYLLLYLLDGRHSISDIQAEYMRKFGQLIYRETIEETLRRLDEGLFLESETFRIKRNEIETEFRRAEIRPATLAGKSYESSPAALSRQIEGFFGHADGPGIPGRREGSGLKGIIAPHIDFTRGGPCFAWAYKEVAERADADIFVIFGTAHTHTHEPYVLTQKDFETPFGALRCNREIVERIQDRLSYDAFADEFAHRGEHSIEFQTVFLSYLFRDRRDISIVPILCGSFHEMVASRTEPMGHDRVTEFVSAVKEALGDEGGRVCFIAGADLAHVGPRFGDPHPVSDGFLKLLERDDLRMLEQVAHLNPAGFFSTIEAENDRRKICGLPPIYTMLRVMEAHTGKLLKYQQWPDPNGTVTFASMAFYA